MFALIRAWPGTVLFAAPTMVRRLLDHREAAPERELKAILYGGGPMYLEDLLAALARFGPKFAQLYGQGETSMTITVDALPKNSYGKVLKKALRQLEQSRAD